MYPKLFSLYTGNQKAINYSIDNPLLANFRIKHLNEQFHTSKYSFEKKKKKEKAIHLKVVLVDLFNFLPSLHIFFVLFSRIMLYGYIFTLNKTIYQPKIYLKTSEFIKCFIGH